MASVCTFDFKDTLSNSDLHAAFVALKFSHRTSLMHFICIYIQMVQSHLAGQCEF